MKTIHQRCLKLLKNEEKYKEMLPVLHKWKINLCLNKLWLDVNMANWQSCKSYCISQFILCKLFFLFKLNDIIGDTTGRWYGLFITKIVRSIHPSSDKKYKINKTNSFLKEQDQTRSTSWICEDNSLTVMYLVVSW